MVRRTAAQAGAGDGLELGADFLGIGLHAFGDAQPGLGDEVHRAQFQRAQGGFGTALGERGDHQHRGRPRLHQLVEEGQAVHPRHFHVEADHVRRVLLDQVAGDEGVRRTADQA
ncbi:hypothetical protein Z046_29745 [Pseudomonas aeruginosa VRFPA09]|nr:hypothetical protein Z046_29745 [Pseudomonas aeruginosa VRFPA09]